MLLSLRTALFACPKVIALDTNGVVDASGTLLMDGAIGGDQHLARHTGPRVLASAEIWATSCWQQAGEVENVQMSFAEAMVALLRNTQLCVTWSVAMVSVEGRNVSQQFLRKVTRARSPECTRVYLADLLCISWLTPLRLATNW